MVKMVRVFITGISGFIGSHLARHLLAKGYEVGGLVHTVPSSSRKNLFDVIPRCRILLGDIRDFQALKSFLVSWSPQYVVHLAAAAIVKTAYRDPIGTFDVNVMGTVKLIQACRDAWVAHTVIQSTDKVYGNQENATVDSPLLPTETYGASKIALDVAAQSFHDPSINIVRMCNVYGYDPNDRIIPNTIRACMNGVKPIIFRGDDSVRQYVYVQDAVEALTYAFESGNKPIYNVAPQTELMNSVFNQEQVVKEVLKHFSGLKPDYRDKPGTYTEIVRQSIVCNMDGWEAKWIFEDGIRQTVEDFRRYEGK